MPNHVFADKKSRRIIALAIVLAMTFLVRVYYNSGPVFANTQDEGLYLNQYAQAIVFGEQQTFGMYANANFSNATNRIFNPADIFKFYLGFDNPEVAWMTIFGFNANNAIYYVIFTSLIEALFIFLILELVADLTTAVIGGILLAFFPLDVLFSVRVLPFVPMAALLAVAIYFLFRYEKTAGNKVSRALSRFKTLGINKLKMQYLFVLLAGFFVGLAYDTHPEGVILLPFLVLYLVLGNRKNGSMDWGAGLKGVGIMLLGAFIGFAATGLFFLATANNFFLYPQADHSVFLYQYSTQNIDYVPITSNFSLAYTTGNPSSYIDMVLQLQQTQNIFYTQYNFLYFSLLGYLALIISAIAIFRGGRYMRFFACLFVFYIIMLTFCPTSILYNNGDVIWLVVNSTSMYAAVLTLPVVALAALGLGRLAKDRNMLLKAFAYAMIIIITLVSISQLNYDVGIYRSSMYTVNQFVSYLATHSNYTYYANPLFVGEVNVIAGYKYNVRPLFNCNASSLEAINGSYLVTGGTLSLDLVPQITASFDDCALQNATGAQQVYYIMNPFNTSSPLRIMSLNQT